MDGMFAFCIYDKINNKYHSKRSFGIKPIYYYFDEYSKEIYFASELKALFEFENVPKKYHLKLFV